MAFLDPPNEAQKRTRRWVALGSLAATAIIITGFLVESRWGYMAPDPKIIYAQSWKGDRSRADALADRRATNAARDKALADARAHIATLSGQAKIDAQKQYDDYVAGGGLGRDIPYVAAQPPAAAIVAVPGTAPAEPPVE